MAVYTQVILGSNLSQLAASVNNQFDAVRHFERGSTEPTIKAAGLLWNCTHAGTLNTLTAAQVGGPWAEAFTRYNGSAWVLAADPRYPALNAGGSVVSAADQNLGGFKLTGVGAGTAAGHAPRRDQCLLRDGLYPATGALNMGGNIIEGLGTPTLTGHATRKDYVDDAVAAAAANASPTRGLVAASGTQQAVALGFQPSLVMVQLEDVDFAGGLGDLDVKSTPAMFADGAGTETAFGIADRPNSGSLNEHIPIEVEFTATGFEVRLPGLVPTGGNLKYAAWR